MDFVHTEPDISVLETEYQRLLGFPRDYVPEGRVRELMDWAASWYAEKGKPWMYGHAVQLRTEATTLTVGGQPFAPSRLSEQVAEAGAERAALVALSAGKQC